MRIILENGATWAIFEANHPHAQAQSDPSQELSTNTKNVAPSETRYIWQRITRMNKEIREPSEDDLHEVAGAPHPRQ